MLLTTALAAAGCGSGSTAGTGGGSPTATTKSTSGTGGAGGSTAVCGDTPSDTKRDGKYGAPDWMVDPTQTSAACATLNMRVNEL